LFFSNLNPTHKLNSVFLKGAEFVDSFNTDERVFFVFNEETKSDGSNPDDGLTIKVSKFSAVFFSWQKRTNKCVHYYQQNVASISQICLNDPGAPLNSLRNIWTSYLKSRLSCVYDASKGNHLEFDSLFQSNSKLFYFNEISKPFSLS
jgi:hypothetical protein